MIVIDQLISVSKKLLLIHLCFLLFIFSSAQEKKGEHVKNQKLSSIKDGEVELISSGYKGSISVLDYSGMVYDKLRHKILTFGGGHATQDFPTSVHEFDLNSLQWGQLTVDVPPEALSVENAVKSDNGVALGGVKWEGKIHAGSRHTYGGLVMIPGTSLMAVGTSMEFPGAALRMPEGGKFYRDNYQGGSGLWIFDPNKKEWQVSKKDSLVCLYGATVCHPKKPDWIYHWGYKRMQMINWKTEETKRLPSESLGTIAFNPKDGYFYSSPCSARDTVATCMKRFNIASGTWEKLTPTGDIPNTYDIMIVYDTFNNVFVCFSRGFAHYYSPKENKWYKLEKLLNADLDNKPMRQHHIYDPVNNVHIVASTRWNTYAYKLSDKAGELPGTSK